MSEHEFEKFLALLSGMLKLDAGQRDEIAGELRDHLEARLSELLAEGVPREKAILVALEEFGDAAGLAAEFLHIVRHQRRRKIMRLTAGSLAATVAIVLGSMAFWPDSHPVQVTPRAVAEQPGAATGASTTLTEPTVEENNATTERKISKRIPAQFEDLPLKEVLEFVFDATDVDHLIRMRKLDEEGIALDMPINLQLKQVRAEMLLDLVLGDFGLTYTIRDGIVIISTQSDPDVALEIRLYNVRDLITMDAARSVALRERLSSRFVGGFGDGLVGDGGGKFFAAPSTIPSGGVAGGLVSPDAGGVRPTAPVGGQPSEPGGSGPAPRRMAPTVPSSDGKLVEDFEPLIDLIQVTVAPETWENVGGSGSAMQYDDGILVVNQSPQVHKKISVLLEKLRELRTKNADAQAEPAKPKK
jgi:hypothetical protein